MAIEKVNAQNFEEKVINNSGLTVVDFFATWCGPCKTLAPILDETAADHPDVTFCKVDIDEEMSLATQYQIMSVPTLLFIKNGEVVKKSIGLISQDDLEDFIAACN